MAKSFMVNVPEKFDITAFADEVAALYQGKGYTVRKVNMKNGTKITVEKGVGGINTVLGMGEAITATCTMQGKDGGVLSVNLSDGDWTGKIIGLVVGWFVCLIPCITAIIGITKQMSLEKSMQSDLEMTANNCG